MAVVGVLTVNLEANTASFSSDLGKASQDAENFGQSAARAGQQVDFSMTEARGSTALLGEELGVHIPRHLQTLIAQIPEVGAAFATMLPLVGVFAAVAIVTKLIEKHEELAKAEAKVRDAVADMTVKLDDQTNALILTNLKLDDQIRKIEQKPVRNGVREALIESHEAVDKLAASFAADFQKIDGVLIEATTLTSRFWQGMKGGTNLSALFTGLPEVQASLQSFNGTLAKVNDLRIKLADAPVGSDAEKAATLELAAAYHALEISAKGALAVAQDHAKAVGPEVIGNLSQAILTAAHAYKDMGLEAENAGKKAQLAGLSDNKENADVLEARNEAVKEFCDKALHAEQEYQHARAEAATRSAKLMQEIQYAENKGVEEAWKQTVKVQEGLASEQSKYIIAAAKLTGQAREQQARHDLAMHQATAAEAMAVEINAANERAHIETSALDQEIASLNSHDADYLVKLADFENKKKLIIQQAANETTKIREQAEQKQYSDISRSEQMMADAVAKNVTKSLLENKNMVKGFEQMGAQMLEAAMQNTLKMIMLGNMQQARDAAHAASATFAHVMQMVPPPEGFPLAAAAAAAAFGGVMAFEEGGEVPGMGAYPAMVHGGETVVTKALTDQVKNNTGGGGGDVHVHTTVNAVDAENFGQLLNKHASTVAAHVRGQLRKFHVRG
jgi:hypothetical protein